MQKLRMICGGKVILVDIDNIFTLILHLHLSFCCPFRRSFYLHKHPIHKYEKHGW